MVDGSVRVRGVTAWLVHLLVKLLRICGRFTREEHLLARSALCGIWLRQENHLSRMSPKQFNLPHRPPGNSRIKRRDIYQFTILVRTRYEQFVTRQRLS